MRIPIRAIYKRAEHPGEDAVMISADYAEVPTQLIAGQLAQAAADVASVKGDMDESERIRAALTQACADGNLMT